MVSEFPFKIELKILTVVSSVSRSHLGLSYRREEWRSQSCTWSGQGNWSCRRLKLVADRCGGEGPKKNCGLLRRTSEGNCSRNLAFFNRYFFLFKEKRKMILQQLMEKLKLDPSSTTISSSHFAHKGISATGLNVSSNLDFSLGHMLRSISS